MPGEYSSNDSCTFAVNESHTIAVIGTGKNTRIKINARDDNGDLRPHGVEMKLCDVDRFAVELKRLKDVAEKALDGDVVFLN